MQHSRQKLFGSDNYSGVHPRVFEEMAKANVGHVSPYGYDEYTRKAVELLQGVDLLGKDSDIRFVWNGTGANVVSLAALLKPYESVICPRTAHINCDECGAPEHVAGIKLIPVDTTDGKLTPALIEPYLSTMGFEHAAQPRVISISNSTEFGTVYSPQELRELTDFAHSRGLLVHCDGARIANAVASIPGATLADFTYRAGLDALSFGGTKNAMMAGEAVVLFGDARRSDIFMIRKSCTQLASKMRYVAAQYSAMFADGLWLECATTANTGAERIEKGLARLGIAVTQKREANEVFVVLPKSIIEPLQDEFGFYTWDGEKGEVRFVASWDTTAEEVDELIARISEYISGATPESVPANHQ